MPARSEGARPVGRQALECAVVYLALFASANYLLEIALVARLNPPSVPLVAFPPLRTMAGTLAVAVALAVARGQRVSRSFLFVAGALCPLVGDVAVAATEARHLWIPRDGYLFAMPLAGLGAALWLMLQRLPDADEAAPDAAPPHDSRLEAHLLPFGMVTLALPALASPLLFLPTPEGAFSSHWAFRLYVEASTRPLMWVTAASALAVWPLRSRSQVRLRRTVPLLIVLLAWVSGLVTYEWLQRSF